MSMSTAMERFCGAKTRSGGLCKKRAGAGTSHPGFGRCKFHLGSTKQHTTHAARLEALEFARGALGQELDTDPLEGILTAVRLSYGIVDHWRCRLVKLREESLPDDDTATAYAKAVIEHARICDLAVKAGVSERQIKIVERMAEQLSLVLEEALATVNLSAKDRQLLAEAYASGLARLEAGTIDGTAEAA